jgi:oligoendopeptidase F
LYISLYRKYGGSEKTEYFFKKPYSYSLSRIPISISHFYVGNFYVYKYAIGQIVAFYIAFHIFAGNKNIIDKYFKFLKSGSSLSPLETIKILGINLNVKKIYEFDLMKIKEILNDFKNIKN